MSVAVAVTATLALTVAPDAGAVIETVGGVGSGGGDWVVASALADMADSFPAASNAVSQPGCNCWIAYGSSRKFRLLLIPRGLS